ncbi:PAS domain S-box protein [Arenibacter sp. M-2]|uniref:PAS domain-containing sensor histidine kinase n=1 Tax=Arenibacter sp. M-2 TaxID=3053612 RepID=UPI0025707A9E|nr:PAS domain S-box protein [Arenibacter sp. M-2]MDL5512782.1 PAS domain S-box protein [Arenibacter sp. M-2]|tara:strand:+ start:7146 stop:9629 length:2484 start_codon:yes stop_codon:yes gene_type:complete
MKLNSTYKANDLKFLENGGQMGDLIREMDWGNTSLGHIGNWPVSLRTTLAIILHSSYPMFLFWGDDLICFYNDAYRPSLGNEGKHPAIGKKGKEVWPEIWEFIGPLIHKVVTTAKPISFSDQLVPFYRNGSMEEIYWTFCYSAAFDDFGNVSGVVVTCTETTETVIAKKELEESEQRLRTMIAQAPVSIAIFQGKDHLTELANSLALEMWGRKESEVLGQPILEVMPELKSQGIKELLDGVYSTGKSFSTLEFPVQIMRKGKLHMAYLNFGYEPLLDTTGKIEGIMALGIEVTDQVIARKRLEESEKKFRLLADSLPQFVWTADPDGNLNYFNQSVFEFSGLSQDQLINRGWLQMVHPDDRIKNFKTWEDSIATGKDFLLEHRFRRHDGEYRWQLSRAKPQRNDGGIIQMWVGSSTDIQEQKIFLDELEKKVQERTAELVELNESLKKSEQRYHLMVEEVQDYAILYLNPEGIVENWNTGAEKIKGYKAEEIIGKDFSNFYTEEDKKSGLPKRLLGMAARNGKAVQEGWRVRKDKKLFWASVVITAVHNEFNELIGYSKVTHDLTVKKESDDALKEKRAELEEKNIELQKMNKELQSFAYISSHDLQEPLRKIQTFASRIIEKDKDTLSENGKYLFKRMQLSAERMQSLIEDLLAYSRTHNLEGDFEKTNLNLIIEEVKQELSEELLQKNAVIDTDKTCEVKIIPFQFKQLFYNLISNSLKFSSPGKAVRITIKNEFVNGQVLDGENIRKDKNYCHIIFTDNGIGFDQEYSEKIFELFQRLHGRTEYPGTGIGLAIIKRIVENHNGIITAKSQVGKGATFDIYLPAE